MITCGVLVIQSLGLGWETWKNSKNSTRESGTFIPFLLLAVFLGHKMNECLPVVGPHMSLYPRLDVPISNLQLGLEKFAINKIF